MLLTLEVVSANGVALGANRRKAIGAEGATIGRAPDNDWFISDQYVSRLNARIHCLEGAFYVEGLGLNRLAMHEATNFIANHEPQRLRSGDRLFLGPYEIRATISMGRAAVPAQNQAETVHRDDGSAATSRLVTQLPPAKRGELHKSSLLDDTDRMPQPIVVAPESAGAAPERRNESPLAEPVTADPTETYASLDLLLHSAGLPGSRMTPEIAAEIGDILRIVVQGVMDVLQSRAEIKAQLRTSMTRIKPTENNPLKFSPNVEAALHALLVERSRGYLPMVRSFEEALFDIRHHQIAVLEGIRVAYDSLLEQFDPQRIESGMQQRGKARFRDYYAARFAQLAHDRDESFQSLFGEPFVRAYEEQMERLNMSAKPTGLASNLPGPTAQLNERPGL